MARLPQPGSDQGTWGDVLNDYLGQSHTTDGSLKADSVGAPQLKSNAVTATAIADSTITTAKLDSTVQANLTKANTALQVADVTGKLDTSTAASTYIPQIAKGATSGVASLDSSGLLPEAQVPARLAAAGLSATFVSFIAAAKNPDILIVGSITRNANDVVTSASVVWPDGTVGTFTTDTIDASGAINSYHITYGSPVTKTFTQPVITRSATGAATSVPQIVVS